MTLEKSIAERFARDIAKHQLTILHDDGLYRHLRFRQPDQGIGWFALVTVPGSLIFQGDGESFVFSRIEDMFEFFRGPVGQINPGYWSEKVTTDLGSLQRYDQQLLEDCVRDSATEFYERLPGLESSVQSEVLGELVGDESIDVQMVQDFEFYVNDQDRYAWPRKNPDFRFVDVWEWNCRDYYWWFLWACHAIVWGIAQYDAAQVRTP